MNHAAIQGDLHSGASSGKSQLDRSRLGQTLRGWRLGSAEALKICSKQIAETAEIAKVKKLIA